MSKINLLSSKVYNRIAAGEVVERPYSAVKELIENSIDANADKITIEISDGGLSNLTVSDNGIGIEKDDLKKALMPHATSKISSIKDLDNIFTLGFRGEALASIASVSKLTIKSKTADDDVGSSVYSEGGIIGDIEECATTNGTEISVNNLFFNAPVRAKFLKSAKSEENDIYATIARFILGNPEISFKYVSDGKVLLQSFGDGIESAFCCVYGADVLKNCFNVNTVKNGITIKGYIGKHNFTKPNRSYQTIFLNGRYIQNQTISSAISNAYASYLMKRQYPFYFLNINLPPDAVDVNVTPSKTDVRFINNQIVYGSIYSVISKVLDGTQEALDIVVETETQKTIDISDDFKVNYVTHNENKRDPFALTLNDVSKEEKTNNDIFEENKKYLEELERKNKEQVQIKNPTIIQNDIKIKANLKFIGQALNTFLIYEDGNDLYLVDQHAAHERILFDKICDSYNNGKIIKQPLLLPYVLNLSALESDFILNKTDFLSNMGFEIEEFGRNSFKVSTVPAYLSEIDLKKFFDEILADVNTLKVLSVDDVLFNKLAQKACKSAVKSGDKLTDLDVSILTDALNDNIGLKCPHGRPVAIKISRTEIDKWFKRIV